MGINDTPRMADAFGIPTYYITDVIKEDAGGGNARIWNCQLRHGILVPQCEVIIHSSRLLPIGREVSSYALELYHREQMAALIGGCAHH